MINDDFISVIITTYNRKEKLSRAINSVLNQSYKKIEIIVIDDCSKDGTEQMIKENFKSIRYFKNLTNLGVSKSRNVGIKLALYKIVAFLDDDDEWLPNKLQISVNEMANGTYDFVFTQFYKGSKTYPISDHVDNNFMFYSILCNPIISPSTLICKKSTLLDIGLFNTEIKCFEDYELSLRLAKNSYGKFIPLALTNVNFTENSLSSDNNAEEGLKTRISLFIKYLNYIKQYKLEKSWLRGLTNFQYFMDFNKYKKLMAPIFKMKDYNLNVERNYIEEKNYDRLIPYKFFDSFDKPFWSVTTKLDINKLVLYCKNNNYSFYGAMSYIILSSCNNIKNFRLRKEGEYLFDYQKLQAQFTVLTKSGNADITRRIEINDFPTFISNFDLLKKETFNETIPPHPLEIYDNVIFLSCLPWFDYSQLEPAINYSWKDYIPRITWSKYFKENENYLINISLTVHHAFIDGFHIQQFISEIKKQIDLLVNT